MLAAVVCLLAAAGVLPRWAGVVHLVALPPLDLVSDVTTLLVHAPGWLSFAGGVVVSVVGRAAVLALLLGGLSRHRFLRALRFYVVVLPFAFLAATMFYAAGAVLYYGFFWIGLLVTVPLVAFSGALVWQSPARLRSAFAAAARRGFRMGTMGSYLALLAMVGALADLDHRGAAVVSVPVSAGLTWAAAQALHRDPGWRAGRRALAGVLAAGLAALFVVAASGPTSAPPADPPVVARQGAVMLMSGIDSRSGRGAMLEVDPHYMGWTCDRTFYFSYAGPGQGQPQGRARCPITHGAPYRRADTVRSRVELVPFLQAQAAEMPRPGVVAGHSQAAWLAWEAAAEGRLGGVETIVLVGAFAGNSVGYPAAGENGPGKAGREVLEKLVGRLRQRGITVFEPDSPLGREWLGEPGAVEATLARRLPPAVRALSVTSAFDLPLVPTSRITGATNACPLAVIHPNLPHSPELQDVIVAFVDQHPLPRCPIWRRAIGPLFRHFAASPSRR